MVNEQDWGLDPLEEGVFYIKLEEGWLDLTNDDWPTV